MEKIKWTKFKKKLPTEGSKIKVKFGNGKIVIGTVQGKDIVYPKWSFNSLTGVTLTSGQQEWFEIGETRGKAKKPRRSGRKAIEDPKVVDPKNRPTDEEIDSLKNGGNMERLVYKCIDLIKTGVSLDGCKSIMSEEINPNTKRPFAERFLQEISLRANALIKESYRIQNTNVVALHTSRYDSDIQALLSFVPSWALDEWKRTEAKNLAYMQCLDAIHQKEKLLGMHQKNFKIVVNNEDTVIIKEKRPDIDLAKLTLEEKIELNSILEKSRRTEDEIGGVILRSETQSNIVEDVQHEVIEEKRNVDRIENKTPKEIPEVQEGTALMNVQERLRLTLLKRAQEEFKKAGSRTAENDTVR